MRAADAGTVLVGVCEERSPLWASEALDAAGTVDQLAHVLRGALREERRWLVLIDDAPRVDDVDGVLTALLKSGRPDLHLITAGRAEGLRSGLRPLEPGGAPVPHRCAAAAQPGHRRRPADPASARRLSVPLVPGRGFVVASGELALAQIALPPDPPPTG